MTNPVAMVHANDAHFESKKNMQAATITLAILAAIFPVSLYCRLDNPHAAGTYAGRRHGSKPW